MPRTRLANAVLAIFATLLATPNARAAETEPALTVGSVARGVLDPRAAGVFERYRAALKDPRPELRAAAARAITLGGIPALLADLRQALVEEKEPSVAGELVHAAVVLGPPADDAQLLAAVRDKATAQRLGEALLRVRGAAAVREHLPGLLKAGFTFDRVLAKTVITSSEMQAEVARFALAAGDAKLLDEVLRAQRPDAALMAAEPVKALLSSPRTEIRQPVLAYLAAAAAAGPEKFPADVRDLVASLPRNEPDLHSDLHLELLHRALGRPPRPFPAWMTSLAGNRADAVLPDRRLLSEAAFRLFSPDEQKALAGALPGIGKKGFPEDQGTGGRTFHPAMWLLEGLPPGYREGVLESSGCRPTSSAAGGATITFRPDGRPRSVSPLPSPLSPECQDAAVLLAASSLFPSVEGPVPEGAHAVLVMIERDPQGCEDDRLKTPSLLPPQRSYRVGGRIQPPKKIRNVPATYPEQAKRERRDGVVIIEASVTRSGCVEAARVLLSPDARLSWAALEAVAQWRYTPTLLDGVTVPVIMTATVNFRLD